MNVVIGSAMSMTRDDSTREEARNLKASRDGRDTVENEGSSFDDVAVRLNPVVTDRGSDEIGGCDLLLILTCIDETLLGGSADVINDESSVDTTSVPEAPADDPNNSSKEGKRSSLSSTFAFCASAEAVNCFVKTKRHISRSSGDKSQDTEKETKPFLLKYS